MAEIKILTASELGLTAKPGDQPSPLPKAPAFYPRRRHPRENPIWRLAQDPEQRANLFDIYQQKVRPFIPTSKREIGDLYFDHTDGSPDEIVNLIARIRLTTGASARIQLTSIFTQILGPVRSQELSPSATPREVKPSDPINYKGIVAFLNDHPEIREQIFPPDKHSRQEELSILRDHYLDELTDAEIAGQSGHKIGTVKQYRKVAISRINRRRELLPSELWETSTPQTSAATIVEAAPLGKPSPTSELLPLSPQQIKIWAEEDSPKWQAEMKAEIARRKRGDGRILARVSIPESIESLTGSWAEFWGQDESNITPPLPVADSLENKGVSQRLKDQGLTLSYLPDELCYSTSEALGLLLVSFPWLKVSPVSLRLINSIEPATVPTRAFPGWRTTERNIPLGNSPIEDRVSTVRESGGSVQSLIEYLATSLYTNWREKRLFDDQFSRSYVDLTGQNRFFGTCSIQEDGTVKIGVGEPNKADTLLTRVRASQPIKL